MSEQANPEKKDVELSADELEQVAGGTPTKGTKDITFGVQKDKMASANKNADAVRSLL